MRDAQFDSTGARIAGLSEDVRVWEASSGKLLAVLHTPTRDLVRIGLSPGGRLAVARILPPASAAQACANCRDPIACSRNSAPAATRATAASTSALRTAPWVALVAKIAAARVRTGQPTQ